ncbi:Hypothetical_protein [Hexamita inflata]|uniref:Hypothetical_protein n=1 Tax=Hexamita inflata TaxID=28002 RepID=A0AA86TXE6_9EUKA|nr:Hypothetical protein HINF_LOCUS12228 [Hexamita inflata]
MPKLKAADWFHAAIIGDIDMLIDLSDKYNRYYDNVDSEERRYGLCALHYAILNKRHYAIQYLFALEFDLLTLEPISVNGFKVAAKSSVQQLAVVCQDPQVLEFVLTDPHKHIVTEDYTVHQNNARQTAIEVFAMRATEKTACYIFDGFLSLEFDWLAQQYNRNLIQTAIIHGNYQFLSYFTTHFDNFSTCQKLRLCLFCFHEYCDLEALHLQNERDEIKADPQYFIKCIQELKTLKTLTQQSLNELRRTKMIKQHLLNMKIFSKQEIIEDAKIPYMQLDYVLTGESF